MRFIYIVLAMLCLGSLSTMAQQSLEDKRSATPFFYKDFKPAKIILKDNRFVRVDANIFLKNGRLIFKDKGKVLESTADNILQVEFDSAVFMLKDKQMLEVVAKKGANRLLRLVTIDQQKLKDETTGGDNLPFFELADLNVFIELDGDKQENARLYPLTTSYYFHTPKGYIDANQTQFKKHLRPELKEKFRDLMFNKYWSWKDAQSLTLLLDFIKD